jgi:hypothetical protein
MEYRRQVAMRCDGEDFVVAIQPEDEIIFRTKDARALRNLCRRLRWHIAIDTTLSIDVWTWPPNSDGAESAASKPPASARITSEISAQGKMKAHFDH